MSIGKILMEGTCPSKIIRKGNQYVKTKIIVTPQGNISAKLKGDMLTIDGCKSIKVLNQDKKSQQLGMKIFFEHLEEMLDKKNDATQDLIEVFKY